MSNWTKGKFLLATDSGAVERSGWLYKGLGMHVFDEGVWTLTHVATGLQVCQLLGQWADARSTATEIAEAGDWSFRTYRSMPRGLGKTVAEMIDRSPHAIRDLSPMSPQQKAAATRVSRKVAEARA